MGDGKNSNRRITLKEDFFFASPPSSRARHRSCSLAPIPAVEFYEIKSAEVHIIIILMIRF